MRNSIPSPRALSTSSSARSTYSRCSTVTSRSSSLDRDFLEGEVDVDALLTTNQLHDPKDDEAAGEPADQHREAVASMAGREVVEEEVEEVEEGRNRPEPAPHCHRWEANNAHVRNRTLAVDIGSPVREEDSGEENEGPREHGDLDEDHQLEEVREAQEREEDEAHDRCEADGGDRRMRPVADSSERVRHDAVERPRH